jgi:hypothetical protein
MKKSRVTRVSRVPLPRKRRNHSEFEKILQKLEINELNWRQKSPFRNPKISIKTAKYKKK